MNGLSEKLFESKNGEAPKSPRPDPLVKWPGERSWPGGGDPNGNDVSSPVLPEKNPMPGDWRP